jgi:hypothetical protein
MRERSFAGKTFAEIVELTRAVLIRIEDRRTSVVYPDDIDPRPYAYLFAGTHDEVRAWLDERGFSPDAVHPRRWVR